MRRTSLFSIAPDQPFLPTLADGVLDGTLLSGWARKGPFWLSDVTIIVPTRRARLALADLFATRLGGAALLPDIRTFGGEVEDEEPFLPPFDAPNLPGPASTMERTLFLARLIDAWARTPGGAEVLATPPNAAEIFALAQSLASLRDDLVIEQGSLAALEAEIDRLDLAGNWQKTRKFIEIALSAWEAMLAAETRADPADLRNLRLARQADTAQFVYGDRPVIAAGSTGSVPATADLLAAIAKLPRGALVLPGLDHVMTPDEHQALLDHGTGAHGHPQYGLARLLRRLGTSPANVERLGPESGARVALLRQALAHAEATAHWAEARAVLTPTLPAALADIGIIAARSIDQEALAIAIAARAALDRGETVGIISPDQTLSRRIAMDLKRFGIEIDDAAGVPLFQSAIGRLVRAALAAAMSDFAPLDVMTLLQNRAVVLGHERAEIARLSQRLDLVLRGQRAPGGIAGLVALLRDAASGTLEHVALRPSLEEAEDMAALLEALGAALAPLVALTKAPHIDAADFATALHHAVDGLVDEANPLQGRQRFTAWADDLGSRPGAGPRFKPNTLDGVLAVLMAGETVTDPAPARADIAIWGQLEARLMSPDLLVVAGLNEEIWPRAADPGPWLSRGMRIAAGLEPPERQQGQAAHDFEMAFGNSRLLIAYAERRGTSPALPSRYLQRLDAFIGRELSAELRRRGALWLDLADRLDTLGDRPVAAPRPRPTPPATERPRKITVTEAETLFRSPYDLYAKYVLGLRRLPGLGEALDTRERGSMIHEVFARFVEEGHDFAAPDATAIMLHMAEEEFGGLDAIGDRRDLWLSRFAVAARQYLDWELQRHERVRTRRAEIKGSWTLPAAEPFTITGKADRIDVLKDGSLEILDFKTGSIPDKKTMKAFEAPQLLLEARMAAAGAFGPELVGAASALIYLKLGLGPEALDESPFGLDDDTSLADAVAEIESRLARQVEALLLSGERPMVSALKPALNRRYAGDYDHLARMAEWTADGEEEAE